MNLSILKKKRWRNTLIVLGGVAVCIIGYAFMPSSSDRSSGVEAFYEVARKDLLISIKEGGSLSAVHEVIVKNQLSGVAKIIYIVPEGTYVKKGDLLVELDSSDTMEKHKLLEIDVETSRSALVAAKNKLLIEKSTVESDVRAAEKDIEFARMDLEKFVKLDRAQQLRDAQSGISTAEDSYRLTEQRYQWSKKLAARGFETKSQVERDELEVKGKAKALETAKSHAKMLELYDLPKEHKELQSKFTESQKKFERVETQGYSEISQAEAALSSSKIKLQLTEQRLEELNKEMANAKIMAPKNGLVIYPKKSRYSRQDPIEKGASVVRNSELISLPDVSQMKVIIKVPEHHVSQVKKGQKAYVVLDSLPDQQFNAEVVKVGVVPESNRSWMSSGEKSYVVEVLIADKLPDVKPGISAKVEIVIANLEEVLFVPVHAIQTDKGRKICQAKRNGSIVEIEVSRGKMNNTFIEITDGLQEGDQILLSGPGGFE